jgi:putative restriction endonuclease
MASIRRSWGRDELLVAFNLYCRTPFGRLHRQNPQIIALAEALGRTPSSVAMKLCNFASLDPIHRARGVTGLSGASKADAEVFGEFSTNWASAATESEAAIERLQLRPLVSSEEVEAYSQTPIGPTEAPRIIMIRRVQSLFRATVLASYDSTCAISGINVPGLLNASHIIPWSQSESRRIDPRNGIALSALHDRAFDRGLISIDKNFCVIVSGRLRVGKPTTIHREALLAIDGHPLRLPSRFKPDLDALLWHRQHVFVA